MLEISTGEDQRTIYSPGGVEIGGKKEGENEASSRTRDINGDNMNSAIGSPPGSRVDSQETIPQPAQF